MTGYLGKWTRHGFIFKFVEYELTSYRFRTLVNIYWPNVVFHWLKLTSSIIWLLSFNIVTIFLKKKSKSCNTFICKPIHVIVTNQTIAVNMNFAKKKVCPPYASWWIKKILYRLKEIWPEINSKSVWCELFHHIV